MIKIRKNYNDLYEQATFDYKIGKRTMEVIYGEAKIHIKSRRKNSL